LKRDYLSFVIGGIFWDTEETKEGDIMSEKLQKMKKFYEFFPYPGRSFFQKPYVFGHLNAHLGYHRHLSHFKDDSSSELISEFLEFQKSGKSQHNFHLKKAFENMKSSVCSSENIALVGSGTDEPLLFRKLHSKNRIYSFDLSRRSLMKARIKLFLDEFVKNIFSLNLFRFRNVFIQGDASTKLLKFKNHFSYIQCFGVLHHQPRPEKLFQSMTRSLNSNGILRLMVYSHHGRRLERRIQKKYESIWYKKKGFLSFFSILKIYLSLFFWQVFNFLFHKKSLKMRFRYLGLFPKQIADAFLHPSDSGLPLEKVKKLIDDNGYKIISFEVYLFPKGYTCRFHEDAQSLFDEAILEDKKGNLLSNPVFVLKKNAE
jgi:SAM-dependent methyltransferase